MLGQTPLGSDPISAASVGAAPTIVAGALATVDGTASVGATGSSLAAGSAFAAGAATVAFVSGYGSNVSPAAGLSIAAFDGAAVATASAQAAGTSSAAFAGSSTGGPGGGTLDPSAIWSVVLPNGQTAGQVLLSIIALADDLHRIHGLAIGTPLNVTGTSRTAGGIEQAVSESGGTVTVTRVQ